MGAPLSTLVAEVYMSHMEKKILAQAPQALLYYARFVDDIIGVWCGTEASLHQFLLRMNRFSKSVPPMGVETTCLWDLPNIFAAPAKMTFTLEIGGSSVSYLDLLLRLVPKNPGLVVEFEVFRKKTYTGVSINNESLHPHTHKVTTVNYAIHRLLSLPLSEDARNREIQCINQVAQKNGLSLNVPAMVRRKSLRLLLNQTNSIQAANHNSNPLPPPSISLASASVLRKANSQTG